MAVLLILIGAGVLILSDEPDLAFGSLTIVIVIGVVAGLSAILIKLMVDNFQAERLRGGKPRLKFSRKRSMPVFQRAGMFLGVFLVVIGLFQVWRHWPEAERVVQAAQEVKELPAAPTVRPVAPPAAPTPVAVVSPDSHPTFDGAAAREAISQQTEGWRSAWAERRIDDYLGYYSGNFRSPDGLTRAVWEKQRRDRIGIAKDLSIRIDRLEFLNLTPMAVTISFRQHYHSSTYSDISTKTLAFERVGDQWRIAREYSGR